MDQRRGERLTSHIAQVSRYRPTCHADRFLGYAGPQQSAARARPAAPAAAVPNLPGQRATCSRNMVSCWREVVDKPGFV